MSDEKRSCLWCEGDALLKRYHDEEWGARQLHDDRRQFEFLTLETMQCGLSWMTVLRKREAMRSAFDGFDPVKIAAYDDEKVLALLALGPDSAGQTIIRSGGKIRGMVNNARRFLALADKHGSFDRWFWRFTRGKTLIWPTHRDGQIPAKNALSEKMSAEMKAMGFRYLGPVVLYSHMQAAGMINDHERGCFAFSQLGGEVQTPESEYGLF